MRATIALLCPLVLLAGTPAWSRDQDQEQPEKPVTERNPNMGDAVTTPVSDLNLKKGEIPPILIAAQERPYHVTGLDRCAKLSAAIGELDAVLGEDIDLPQSDGRGLTAGRVAQEAVGSFIPFRGLIREISGANTHERRLQAAVEAGIARRSFLKGLGQGRGCAYPARAVTLEIFNERQRQIAAAKDGGKDKKADKDSEKPRDGAEEKSRGPKFVSQPVVQKTD